MTERNYTNSADSGRFGFSESGTYRAPYKAESALVVVFVSIFVVFALAGAIAAVWFVREMIMTSPPDVFPMLFAIAGVIMFAFAAGVGYLIFRLGVAYTQRGFKCTFSATEDRFTATIGGDVHVIFYSDVVGVLFTPRSVLGKIRGYDVDVILNSGKTHRYGVAFEGYQSEKHTPFYIIKDRVELIEQRRSKELAKLAEMKLGGSGAIGAEEEQRRRSDVIEQMNEAQSDAKASPAEPFLQNAGEEMLSVSVKKNSAMTASAPAKSEKPNIMIVGNDGEMLSIGRGSAAPSASEPQRVENTASATELEKINRARELDEREIIGQGVFWMGRSKKTAAVLNVMMITLTIIAVGLVAYSLISDIGYLFAGIINFPIYAMLIFGYLVLIIPILLYARSGVPYRYTADAREFRWSRENGKGPVVHIFYKDARAVSYKPLKFLWFDNGYEVTIETTGGKTQFRYVFPRFNHRINVNRLPFEIIRENLGGYNPPAGRRL